MPEVVALTSFDHYGKRKRGSVFMLSDQQTRALERAGLVAVKGSKLDPFRPVGKKPSALPAGQVLPQTIVNKSRRGGRRKKAEPSSSLTQPSE